MGKYQVTQKQWEEVMGAADDRFNDIRGDTYGIGDDYPMYYVSWYDALVFCNKLSVMEGLTPAYRINGDTDPAAWGAAPTSLAYNDWDDAEIIAGSTGYRLPTEAQWEYACRGDYTNKDTETNTKPFGIGDGTKITGDMANFKGQDPYDVAQGGEYTDSGTYLMHTTPVGSYGIANSYGLYDMHGNVYEWCWDWYGVYPSGAGTDPEGVSTGSYRVLRGGSADATGRGLRSAFRSNFNPGIRLNSIGFRVVRP